MERLATTITDSVFEGTFAYIQARDYEEKVTGIDEHISLSRSAFKDVTRQDAHLAVLRELESQKTSLASKAEDAWKTVKSCKETAMQDIGRILPAFKANITATAQPENSSNNSELKKQCEALALRVSQIAHNMKEVPQKNLVEKLSMQVDHRITNLEREITNDFTDKISRLENQTKKELGDLSTRGVGAAKLDQVFSELNESRESLKTLEEKLQVVSNSNQQMMELKDRMEKALELVTKQNEEQQKTIKQLQNRLNFFEANASLNVTHQNVLDHLPNLELLLDPIAKVWFDRIQKLTGDISNGVDKKRKQSDILGSEKRTRV
ncbi:hypothetical protein BC833DRAFT_602623 [Globomyces pollinis-pini]|nr:hypothetical protein BC833DRAFT_602623 [Globomyces pollinis-pini]